MLVIGVGGGIDVMIALEHGARHVTAVEINRAMIEMVTTASATTWAASSIRRPFRQTASICTTPTDARTSGAAPTASTSSR